MAADLFCTNQDALRNISISDLPNLTEAYVGVLRSTFTWVNNEAGNDDNLIVIIPSSNPPSGRWICTNAPPVPNQVTPWNQINKDSSSLADLTTRSASDLNAGTISSLRLPANLPNISPVLPNLILTTDSTGRWQLSTITADQIGNAIPVSKIDWTGFAPETIGAESIIYFNQDQFNQDSENNISIKAMTDSSPGVAIPGEGIYTDDAGAIHIAYGTGPLEALEGTTPLGGDLEGVHSSAIVNALRNVPLTFFPNELAGMDGYVLTLNATDPETPFFYLEPMTSGGGGSGAGLPPYAGRTGALQTDGTTIFWAKIPASAIQQPLAITSFSASHSSAEVGQSFSSITFNAAYNETVTQASISTTSGTTNLTTPFNSVTLTGPFELDTIGSINFTLHVTGSDTTTTSASINIPWLPRIFYGTALLATNFVDLISNLQNSYLSNTRSGSWTVNASGGEYIYYALPNTLDFGIVFSSGGFSGGFSEVATNVSITNAYGITLEYDVYKSDNVNLGSTTIVVS